jgi:Ras-related protein Rab-23
LDEEVEFYLWDTAG